MSRKPKPKNTLSAGQRVALQMELEKSREGLQLNTSDKAEATDAANISVKDKAPAPEVKKEKMQSVSVKVDFAIDGGEYRRLHGMCGGPVSEVSDISHLFRSLKVPCVYLGKDGVTDIGKIFKNIDADERDEANYDFRELDGCVLSTVNSGAKIIFGVTDKPENLERFSRDPDKLCRICVNIIKHYNEYWHGGFALGLRYFDLLPCELSGGSVINKEARFELYARVSDAIKLYDESLMVGGMNFFELGADVREFIRFCQKRNASLDFLSVGMYSDNAEGVGLEAQKYIRLLKNSAYSESEIIVSEWGYAPGGMKTANSKRAEDAVARRGFFEKRRTVFGASFDAAVLLLLQTYPEISYACEYSGEAGSLWCDICDTFGIPEKPYYAIESYSRLVNAEKTLFCRVEEKEGCLHSGVYAGASANDGEAYILISAYDGCSTVDLRLDNIPDNLYNADIYMLDGVKNLDIPYTVELSGMRKRLLLNISPYSVIFVKLY